MSRSGAKQGGKKKGGASREDIERLQREEEERARQENTLRLEKEAEERQRLENEARDELEAKERKRAKKEAQLKLIAEKEETVVALTAQLSKLQASFTGEKLELEDELNRMQHLKDSLLNELSTARSEHEESQRQLLDDRAQLTQTLDHTSRKLADTTAEKDTIAQKLKDTEDEMGRRVAKLTLQVDELVKEKQSQEKELGAKIRQHERELEKLASVNTTLQEVVENREADDRKNLTLMQMLNTQLDENKRRFQELIDDEKAKVKELQKEAVVSSARIQELILENDQHVRDKVAVKKKSDSDISEYKTKVDQFKFDLKFLHSELDTYKKQLSKQQTETTTIRTEATSQTQQAKLDLEAANKKVEELEALLRRKDREHFDKVTFLNAQISNNRTIISQMQQKMNKEKDERAAELRIVSEELSSKAAQVERVHSDLQRKKEQSADVETQLNSDVAIFKSTIFQLQSALVEKEKDYDVMSNAKDEEIRRLRRKLDEHFIPHRNEIDTTSEKSEKPVEAILNEKIQKLTKELEVKNRVALEAETRLKAQLSNQNHIIDSLQVELLKTREEFEEQIKVLQAESERLKKTLEVNMISYRS